MHNEQAAEEAAAIAKAYMMHIAESTAQETLPLTCRELERLVTTTCATINIIGNLGIFKPTSRPSAADDYAASPSSSSRPALF